MAHKLYCWFIDLTWPLSSKDCTEVQWPAMSQKVLSRDDVSRFAQKKTTTTKGYSQEDGKMKTSCNPWFYSVNILCSKMCSPVQLPLSRRRHMADNTGMWWEDVWAGWDRQEQRAAKFPLPHPLQWDGAASLSHSGSRREHLSHLSKERCA